MSGTPRQSLQITKKGAGIRFSERGEMVQLAELQDLKGLLGGCGGSNRAPDGSERSIPPRFKEGKPSLVCLINHVRADRGCNVVKADCDSCQAGVIQSRDEFPLTRRVFGDAQADGHEEFVRTEPTPGIVHLATVGP